MSASDRAFFDLDELRVLQASVAELRARLVVVMNQLPLIPFTEAHGAAESLCDQISRAAVELQNLLYEVKSELRTVAINLELEEADETLREYEAEQERKAIQEETPEPCMNLRLDPALVEALRFGDTNSAHCGALGSFSESGSVFCCTLPAGHDRQHEARDAKGNVLAVWWPPLDVVKQQLVTPTAQATI